MHTFQKYGLDLQYYKKAIFPIFILLLLITIAGITAADDLDDGISMDDIPYSDDIKTDVCISCIKRKAKAQAIFGSNGDSISTVGGGKAVQGGVYLDKGATVTGDVNVIYEGDNNETIAF